MRTTKLTKKELSVVSVFLRNGNKPLSALQICRELELLSNKKQTIINWCDAMGSDIVFMDAVLGEYGVGTHQLTNVYRLRETFEAFALIAYSCLEDRELSRQFICSDYAKKFINKKLAVVVIDQMIWGAHRALIKHFHRVPYIKCHYCNRLQRGLDETWFALERMECPFCNKGLELDLIRGIIQLFHEFSKEKFTIKKYLWLETKYNRKAYLSWFGEVMKLSPTALRTGLFVPLTSEVMHLFVLAKMDIPSKKITGPRNTNYYSDARVITLFMVSSLISDRYNYPELFKEPERKMKADQLISVLWPTPEEIVKYRKEGIPFLKLPGIDSAER